MALETKRIGVLSDTHIASRSQRLPSQLLEDFASVDLILHAGDWVDLCLLNQLEPLAEVVGVQGNMDHPNVRLKWPEIQQLEIVGFKIGLAHGWGSPSGIVERIVRRFSEVPNLLIYGHTHIPTFEKRGDLHLFNPGSTTGGAYTSDRSYGIITLGTKIQAEIIPLD